MPRPPRIVFPGALFHVMSRGVERRVTFTDHADHEFFLRALRKVVERYRLLCHAYCLMPNHYHLLLETPAGNLSRAMQHLNGLYAGAFNRRHARVGHLFQGRFKSALVEKQRYLLVVSRYVVLNPVRAGLVRLPHHWPWSSFRATAGMAACPAYLSVGWLLRCFDDADRSRARRAYGRFVLEGIGRVEDLAARLERDPVLGGSAFVRRFLKEVEESQESLETVPKRNRLSERPQLAELLDGAADRHDRDRRIVIAHLQHGYSLTAIARHLGTCRATASRALSKARTRQEARPTCHDPGSDPRV